jgi:hypothetical protein
MPRLLLILLVALGGAAIWRRKEIRNDADRASKALADAAESATSRIRPSDPVAEQQDGDEMAAAEAEGNAEPNADETNSSAD